MRREQGECKRSGEGGNRVAEVGAREAYSTQVAGILQRNSPGKIEEIWIRKKSGRLGTKVSIPGLAFWCRDGCTARIEARVRSYAVPPGLVHLFRFYPGLSPWAVIFRRFAAVLGMPEGFMGGCR